jgi:regulator of protease activity HflC (stomatin/prohibitin superfamily)
MGSANPETPAGYVGYLVHGAVFGRAYFYGLQTGPTSAGRTWLLRVINVSITPYTYDEDFNANSAVLSKDNLKIEFSVHLVWKVKPDQVQQFVEHYSTLSNDSDPSRVVVVAYQNFLKEPLRTYARDEIQQYNGLEIKDQITPIGQAISARVLKLTTGTPFEVTSVVVGNIQYPKEVADAVSNKMAATQILERKKIEINQEEMEKQKRIVQAEGIARAMEVINQRLTPMYLQHEAIDAQSKMINSPNHTTIYIPVGPNGVPLVGTVNATPLREQSK